MGFRLALNDCDRLVELAPRTRLFDHSLKTALRILRYKNIIVDPSAYNHVSLAGIMMRGLMVSSHAADTGYSDLYATAVTSLAYCRDTASHIPNEPCSIHPETH